ncbi:MAG: glycosyltransferase family 9 protein [Candidatus Loosdrechtia sp.]|uniref:glycosyltransferase family 9 protein n=1 Tax=Candidatus Loosdrechtia sp. TaxID=3101272 RepID=UPI003A79E100|nr:MAG: glycosyltransferase family 9 protein [Candidatus Jettenia sp. AMX2]
MIKLKKIIISRTDSIGDVVLTLPMVGVMRSLFPASWLMFLGNTYTKPVIEACSHINTFLNWDEIKEKSKYEQIAFLKSQKADAIFHVFPEREIAFLAKHAKIPYRIGTNRRWYHFFTCNKTVSFTRKHSSLHETQLNLKLLSAIGHHKHYDLNKISGFYGLNKIKPLHREFSSLLSGKKFNLVLHPKSKGSAKEWGFKNFAKLIELLPEDRFNLLITGTREEGHLLKGNLPFEKSHVYNLTGKLRLEELIGLLSAIDGLIGASTGPLHLASALGKHAIGLYSPMRPIHPGRWSPIGPHVKTLVFDENCKSCMQKKDCNCIEKIPPENVAQYLKSLDKLVYFR